MKRFLLTSIKHYLVAVFILVSLPGIKSQAQADWSVETSNMILRSAPSGMRWDYTVGLLLEGMLRVYKRTHDQRYIDFVREWALNHISADGTIDAELNSLDNMMPGYTIIHLYRETGIERFKLAAEKIKERLKNTYPRAPDGSFWHMTTLEGELWLDGLYMGMPFLVTYGRDIDDAAYTYTEAIRQFRAHIDFLKDNQTGLLLHAYDYDGSATWAVPPAKRSPHAWGRAIGWVTMGLSDILDIIPEGFPERDIIVRQYQDLLKSLIKYQDPQTGLWYQVVDRTTDQRNWLETSCSMMFVYSLQRAIQKGFLDGSYQKYVTSGYNGILTKISQGADKTVRLIDICGGTGVSADVNYYFNRPRVTNDNHGLGTFLIMNELVRYDNLPWIVSGPTYDNPVSFGELKMYPNPVSGILTIEYEDNDVNYFKIISAGGSVVSTGKAVVPIQQIDFSGFGQGLFIIEFMKADGNILRRKIFKY